MEPYPMEAFMKYVAVLFDLDGTLLDTTDLIIKSFQHTCGIHLNRQISKEEVVPYFGKTLRAGLEQLGPDCVEQLIETYRAYNLDHHDAMVEIFPGVISTIQRLASQGTKLAVVTSKTVKTAVRGLKLFEIDHYFTAVVGLESTPKHKPDPTPVLLALQLLQIEPHQALMVGDSPFDLQSARAAGVDTAAVRWSELPWRELAAEKPDYTLENMEDLLELIGGKPD